VTIAHRLGTVRDSEVIFLLEHGQLAASGTYDALIASSPAFRKLARVSDGHGALDTSESATNVF